MIDVKTLRKVISAELQIAKAKKPEVKKQEEAKKKLL